MLGQSTPYGDVPYLRLTERHIDWYIESSMVSFLRAASRDAEKLACASKSAFENDIHYGAPGHDGKVGGPPGYQSPDWQRRMMRMGRYYKIVVDNQIVGGFIVFPGKIREYYLGRVFIHQDFQNQGIGTRAMDFMFGQFPLAKSWTLDTPAWNERTRHFYEKLGFQQADTRYDRQAGWDSIIYRRVTRTTT
jgi:ribosomal protein S18 acetylase RimI-like enzyme